MTGIATINLGGRFVGVDVRDDFLTHFVRWVGERGTSARRRKKGSDAEVNGNDLFTWQQSLPTDELEG
jgi:hypothetical protein